MNRNAELVFCMCMQKPQKYDYLKKKNLTVCTSYVWEDVLLGELLFWHEELGEVSENYAIYFSTEE